MTIQSGKAFLMKYQRVLGLFFCLVVAACFSTYALSESPRTWFDEGIFIQVARNVLTAHSYVLRASPTEMVPAGLYTTVGFPVIAPISLSFWMFGVGLLQARAVMVAFIVLMVAAAYWFAYRVWGTRGAVWSTLLIATHAPVYGNGKNVLGEVPGLFFFFLFLLSIVRLERREGRLRLDWILAGFAAGMFMATKPNFLLLLPVLVIAFFLQRKQLQLRWKNLLAGFVAMIIPIGLNLIIQFGFSTAIFSGFGSYANLPGLQQLTGLTLGALILKNALLFVQQSTPAYVLVTVLAWLTYTWVRFRRKIAIPLHELVSLGFVAATIAYFLKMPGFFRYLFVAQVIVFPYVVASCFGLVSLWGTSASKARKLVIVLSVGLAAMIGFQAYQVLYSSWVAKFYQGTRTRELTNYFAQLDPAKRVFFYHAVEAVTFFTGENYGQYFKLEYFNDAFGKDQLAGVENGEPDVLVVAGGLKSEAEAQGLLVKYTLQTTLDSGDYLIFERK